MRLTGPLFASLLAVGAAAIPVDKDNNHDSDSGLSRICRGLNTQDRGCVRYTRGFDVTGVVTEVDLTFPQVRSKCDCIQECLNRRGTCANYVWKFSTPESVASGHRTCTLYSDFNLPAGVTLQFDLASPNNVNINAAKITALGNNPHAGALVPQAFKDPNLNTVPDPDAVSGPVWTLANGQVQC
ncbi:uncharacterized protein N7473_009057 [Penicillium subrubescens]|jgi:hypothetical protein|uniref:Apple domain-containing protein n=1 Tax=Penicillium subrubescens TaxID=1316194 RepID=A0A1Q5TRS3_9EURO|nr:uncharacterized protein N7473_009057 [Penicillium subrubescens]KAJ5886383.1 hypothetical protein N7473_009057 [Penicillium subrubescens]OKP02901.1 hypothetical protein PENSUB_6973 [Penicillium subrubescens]